jgi:hypothetical protein
MNFGMHSVGIIRAFLFYGTQISQLQNLGVLQKWNV